jgi:hypothetical protein
MYSHSQEDDEFSLSLDVKDMMNDMWRFCSEDDESFLTELKLVGWAWNYEKKHE